MKITSTQGRWIEMELFRSSIYLEVFGGYRQQTEVYLNIDDMEFAGFSYLNPSDIFDEDKGIKEAVKDALNNGVFGIVIDDKEVRADIWQAVFRMMEAQKVVNGINAVNAYEKKYGPAGLYEILPAASKGRLKEAVSAAPRGTSPHLDMAAKILAELEQ